MSLKDKINEDRWYDLHKIVESHMWNRVMECVDLYVMASVANNSHKPIILNLHNKLQSYNFSKNPLTLPLKTTNITNIRRSKNSHQNKKS